MPLSPPTAPITNPTLVTVERMIVATGLQLQTDVSEDKGQTVIRVLDPRDDRHRAVWIKVLDHGFEAIWVDHHGQTIGNWFVRVQEAVIDVVNALVYRRAFGI